MTNHVLDQITFFTTCKAFAGSVAIAQQNALLSWKSLGLNILLVGDDAGSKEAAEKYGTQWIKNVARNAAGTPLVNDIFDKAAEAATTPYLAYINADIITPVSLLSALESLFQSNVVEDKFLFCVRRKNLPISWQFDANLEWQKTVSEIDEEYGSWDLSNAVDLFVFSRKLFDPIPEFAIGRMSWDNWLLAKAHSVEASIIDASMAAELFHPIHGYAEHAEGWQSIAYGKEAKKNQQLSAGHGLNLDQAMTHCMLADGSICNADYHTAHALGIHCETHPEKELAAGLKYIADSGTDLSAAAKADVLRTLLWRNQRYFPVWASAQIPEKKIEMAIQEALYFINSGKPASALNGIQDLVGSDILHSVLNHELYIWGAGSAGARALSFFSRHGISIVGFLDSNSALHGESINGIGVISLTDYMQKPKPSKLIVASMYLEEISEQLETQGLTRGLDFYA